MAFYKALAGALIGAGTPSQPREFRCPEQQFKNSTAGLTVLQQRSSGVQHCQSASQCPFHCVLCCLHYLNDPVSASCEDFVVSLVVASRLATAFLTRN